MLKKFTKNLIGVLLIALLCSLVTPAVMFAEGEESDVPEETVSNIVEIAEQEPVQEPEPDPEPVVEEVAAPEPEQLEEPQPAPPQEEPRQEPQAAAKEEQKKEDEEQEEKPKEFSAKETYEELCSILKNSEELEDDLEVFWEGITEEQREILKQYIKDIEKWKELEKYFPDYEPPVDEELEDEDSPAADENQSEELGQEWNEADAPEMSEEQSVLQESNDMADREELEGEIESGSDNKEQDAQETQEEESTSEDEYVEEVNDGIVEDNEELPVEENKENDVEENEMLDTDAVEGGDDAASEDGEQAEEPVSEKQVIISCELPDVIMVGDSVLLTSELIGFKETDEIAYQWMVDKGDGFEEIENANEPVYERIITEESLGWSYMLSVRIVNAG